MDINKLSDEQMNLILDNFGRQCPDCKIRMQPLSTMCSNCGGRTSFKKVYAAHYIEHFEIAKCDTHGSSFHFCSHPKSDSPIADLEQFCIKCIIEDQVKRNVEIIKTDKTSN